MRFRIALLSLLVLLVTAFGFFRANPRNSGVFPVEPPTPYFHYPGDGGAILVVHGLNSSKQIMNELSVALSGAGFEVYSIDLPGHGDSPAGFEATRARKAVEEVVKQLDGNFTVVGHSLGAALLLDLANDYEFKSMVLLSPPPTPVNRIRAERVLVMTGEYDMPRINAFVPELEDGGAGNVDLRQVPWTGHTGAVFQGNTIVQIVEWLGGDASNVRVGRRIAALLILIVWSVVTGIALISGNLKSEIRNPKSDPPISKLVICYVAAVFFAAIFAAVLPIANGLRLFATDYLIGSLFVTGLSLMLLQPRIKRTNAKGLLAAGYVILVPGVLIASHLVDLTLSDGRWWRFPAIALMSLPLFIADESFLRPIRPWWKSAAVAIATRVVLWGLVATGALVLNRGDAFLVLIIHLVVLFWVALWFAAEIVHRYTNDPLATAMFSSIVQAWVFAAMFVTV